MKRISIFLLMLFSISLPVFANSPSVRLNELQREVVVENLLVGLESGNQGLIVSSAQFLGELKEGVSVIPLMKLLHESNDDAVKISAALSLIKIGDLRGVYAVKQAIQFEKSQTVRAMCERFYHAYLKGTV